MDLRDWGPDVDMMRASSRTREIASGLKCLRDKCREFHTSVDFIGSTCPKASARKRQQVSK